MNNKLSQMPNLAKRVLAVDVGLKDKLLVSFSGGETSAYMLWWVLKNWSNNYEIKVVFANTGQENEETLLFVQQCSELFDIEVIWVEANVWIGYEWNYKKYVVKKSHIDRMKFVLRKRYGITKRKFRREVKYFNAGTTHTVVDFKTADRDGKVFESVISKYGIPNPSTPHCNRELKLNAINSYLKSIGWKDYYTAIGIRVDEFDRMNAKAKERKLIYPLIKNKPTTKPKINLFWSRQPFRLKLKGYQGNCKWCWKKSDAKLYQLLKENNSCFDFVKEMEIKYGSFIPETRLKLIKERNDEIEYKTRFFRKNRSVEDLVLEAQNFNKIVADDAQVFDFELDLFDLIDQEESCDIYAECGS